MATTKPRITISLNPHVYATIKRMSELGGQPMASIISEMLDSVHEPLMRTVALLDAAAQAPQQVKDGLRGSFEAVERDLYGVVGYSIGQVDWLINEMGKGGAQAEGRAIARGSASAPAGAKKRVKAKGSTPVPVTRGSGSPVEPPSTPPKQARKPAKTRVSVKGGHRG